MGEEGRMRVHHLPCHMLADCLSLVISLTTLACVRYFQCASNHGVFSVLGKIELLAETTEASVPNTAGVCVCVCVYVCVCVCVRSVCCV